MEAFTKETKQEVLGKFSGGLKYNPDLEFDGLGLVKWEDSILGSKVKEFIEAVKTNIAEIQK